MKVSIPANVWADIKDEQTGQITSNYYRVDHASHLREVSADEAPVALRWKRDGQDKQTRWYDGNHWTVTSVEDPETGLFSKIVNLPVEEVSQVLRINCHLSSRTDWPKLPYDLSDPRVISWEFSEAEPPPEAILRDLMMVGDEVWIRRREPVFAADNVHSFATASSSPPYAMEIRFPDSPVRFSPSLICRLDQLDDVVEFARSRGFAPVVAETESLEILLPESIRFAPENHYLLDYAQSEVQRAHRLLPYFSTEEVGVWHSLALATRDAEAAPSAETTEALSSAVARWVQSNCNHKNEDDIFPDFHKEQRDPTLPAVKM